MHRQLMNFWKDAPNDPFDVLFEHAPVLMHSIDGQGHLLKVSRYWADLLGYQREEMVGRRSTEFLSPESRLKAHEKTLPEYMKTGMLHNVEYDFVTKAGALLPVRMSATSVLDEQGKIVRSIAIMFDNREAKAAEAALRAKAVEAEAANQAKSRFLAAMSHEVRTPMNAIMGFTELLKMSQQDPKAISHADAILTASGSLMALLNDLLDLNQSDPSLNKSVSAPVEIHSTLSNTADWWRKEAVRKGLDLSLDIGSDVPTQVEIDGPRVQKVLNNLLGNAVRFTPTGQVRLTVTSDAAAATLSFEITDTGPGLSANVMNKLAIKFDNVGNEFEKEHGGWGLGLSVSRNLIERMDGTLHIDNCAEGGCRVAFSIPIRTHAIAPMQVALKTFAPQTKLNKNVLVAEDNPIKRHLMQTLLEELGCRVTLAKDGVEAVELAGAGGFDAILMDITMPQLDGVAATEIIQGLPAPVSDVPIVACTANVDERSQARYRRAGMAGFLPKPVRADDIARMLSQVTQESARAQAI